MKTCAKVVGNDPNQLCADAATRFAGGYRCNHGVDRVGDRPPFLASISDPSPIRRCCWACINWLCGSDPPIAAVSGADQRPRRNARSESAYTSGSDCTAHPDDLHALALCGFDFYRTCWRVCLAHPGRDDWHDVPGWIAEHPGNFYLPRTVEFVALHPYCFRQTQCAVLRSCPEVFSLRGNVGGIPAVWLQPALWLIEFDQPHADCQRYPWPIPQPASDHRHRDHRDWSWL